MKRLFFILLTAIVCMFTFTLNVNAKIPGLSATEPPVSNSKQGETLKLISQLIEGSHYRKIPLDDVFSEKIINAYIDQLDPSRSFFSQSGH